MSPAAQARTRPRAQLARVGTTGHPFANALSLFFPDGERYFIHTIRHYRDHIQAPELRIAVTAFIGQDAMHGREHEDYNRLLGQAGLPAEALQAHARRFLEWVQRVLPPAAQLSVTIAQEHFTAILADLVLTEPRILEGADSQLAALWHWHGLEETEHKSVAFDAYQAAVGRDPVAYALHAARCALRAARMLPTTLVFYLTMYHQQELQQADTSVGRWQGMRRFARFMLRSPALLPQLALSWLTYSRPGFHPWDHDNRHLLEQIDPLVAAVMTHAGPSPTSPSSFAA